MRQPPNFQGSADKSALTLSSADDWNADQSDSHDKNTPVHVIISAVAAAAGVRYLPAISETQSTITHTHRPRRRREEEGWRHRPLPAWRSIVRGPYRAFAAPVKTDQRRSECVSWTRQANNNMTTGLGDWSRLYWLDRRACNLVRN